MTVTDDTFKQPKKEDSKFKMTRQNGGHRRFILMLTHRDPNVLDRVTKLIFVSKSFSINADEIIIYFHNIIITI